MPWRGLVFPGVFSVRLLALPGTDFGQAYGPVVAHQRGCAQPAVKRVSGESSAFAEHRWRRAAVDRDGFLTSFTVRQMKSAYPRAEKALRKWYLQMMPNRGSWRLCKESTGLLLQGALSSQFLGLRF